MTAPLRKYLAWLVPALCLIGLAAHAFMATRPSKGMDFKGFGTLPVVSNGRVQPLDSLARNTLLSIHGKQRLQSEDTRPFFVRLMDRLFNSKPNAVGHDVPSTPNEWLAELSFKPALADSRKIFLIHHDDLLGLTGLTHGDGKSFSFDQLQPAFPALQKEAARIDAIEAQARSAYEKALMRLTRNLFAYNQLKHALAMPRKDDMEAELNTIISGGTGAAASMRMREVLAWAPFSDVFTTPSGEGEDGWSKLPDSVIEAAASGKLHPATLAYARLGDAYRAGDTKSFNTAAADYQKWLSGNRPEVLGKGSSEALFNRLAPFIVCMALYVVAFLCAAFSWLKPGSLMRDSAFRVLLIGLALHTAGLITRMVLEGRPPVTNLYSSAIFIGWGAIVLSAALELFHRNAIGTAVASAVGFSTLLIAHHLSLSGDTLEMMRAVLDTNFWLATHVVVITLGYSATFLAGGIAIFYVVCRPLFHMSPATLTSLRGMVYGIICFATLTSFVGTVLGGIWADQSWGRFWGWDPKENGALLIVIWNAIILHSRWGGMVKERGMMVMAIFGNIITSWSWFGTNMLGIGLHSYGFTDAAFFWLSAFIASQLILMGLGYLPVRKPPVAPPEKPLNPPSHPISPRS